MSPVRQAVHIQQAALGYCLPACAQMALAQLGISVNQTHIARTLETQIGVGTPFSRVERLAQWDIHVQLVQRASLQDLTESLAADKAVIVAVTTTPGLPGWGNIRTQHTVLAVSADAQQVAYHDPALPYGPVFSLSAEFLLAWGEMDGRAAFLECA